MKKYFKVVLIVFCLALLDCVALRTLLRLNYMSDTTGFYVGNGDMYAMVFNAVLGATILFLFISNRFRKVDNDYPVFQKTKTLNILAILAGISIIAFALIGSPASTLYQGHAESFETMKTTIAMVFGLASGGAFLMIGLVNAYKSNNALIGIIAVIPAIWEIVLLITRFNSFTTVTTITEYLLLVLFMVFAAVFLVGHARTLCGQMRKDGRNYAIPSGLSAALCGLSLSVPSLVYMALRGDFVSTNLIGTIEYICVLVMSVYMVAFVLHLIKSIKTV